LIVGQNGAGKSTLLDALSYGLFGKPHRNINKPQLVNTINNKDMLVEVDFEIGQAKFRIVRGMKPQIFEIWKNGIMINQDSKALEYQKILEQNILKLNHKSFHQIVVLGSSSFIPFMQLQAQHRRSVIEDLLDINVFSKMNTLVKERLLVLKEQKKDLEYNIKLSTEKVEYQKKFIKELQTLNEQNRENKKSEIVGIQSEINDLQNENSVNSQWLEKYTEKNQDEIAKKQKKRNSIIEYSAQFKQQIRDVVKDAKFYEDNETCPTCTQDISADLRAERLQGAKDRAQTLQKAMDDATEQSIALEQDLERLNQMEQNIRERTSTIHANNNTISRLQGRISTIEGELTNSLDQGKWEKAHEDLSKLVASKDTLMEVFFQNSEENSYNLVMAEMLKDTGIKTKVIKQYLPVINKLVNQYLQVLDFFVHFDLDESFNETIRSRHRDSFSYDSFSEGEKQRIDLALLFTWRMIARMKNSVSTNLLVLDETFDSSLDHDGVENLMKILYTLEDDTNTFIISHKGDILDNKFERKIEFVKDRNFSKIKDLQPIKIAV
jgi:DNA repair exonuclease SbcCD ATPase subunit